MLRRALFKGLLGGSVMSFPKGSVGFQNPEVLFVNQIVISPGGGNAKLELVYSGTPALGNLIESINSVFSASSDKFGNTVLGGHAWYNNTLHRAMTIDGNEINDYFSTSTSPGPYVWNQTNFLSLSGQFVYVPTAAGQNFLVGGTPAAQMLAAIQFYVQSGGQFLIGHANPLTSAYLEVQGSVDITSGGLTVNGGAGIDAATIGTLTVTGLATADDGVALVNQTAPGSVGGQSQLYSDAFTQLHTDRAFQTDVVVETKNQGSPPGAGGAGSKWFGNSGHGNYVSGQAGIGGDTNTYDTGRLTLLTASQQIINSAVAATITGLSKHLGVGTYRIHGRIAYVGNQAGGVPTFSWAFTGTIGGTNSLQTTEITVAQAPAGTQPETAISRALVPLAMAGPTLVLNSFLWLDYDFRLVISAAGTFSMNALTSIAADTFTIQTFSDMTIEPIVAT